MCQYDVAVGLDADTLNRALVRLMDHSGVAEKVLRGHKKVDVPTGYYDLDWEIAAPPQVSFAPVPDLRWDQAKKGQDDLELPDDDVFTLVVPRITLGLAYNGGERKADTTEANLFAHLKVSGGKVTVDPLGLWVDRTQLANIQAEPLDSLSFFGLEMAEQALTDLTLPEIPPVLGLQLGPPEATIVDERLVVGVALAPRPVKLAGGSWPAGGTFALVSPDLLNALVQGQVPQYVGQKLTWRRSALGSPGGPGAAYVEGVGELREAHVQVNEQRPNQVGANLRVALRGGALFSLLEAVGLSAIVRLLEKLYLAYWGLGYGAQVLPGEVFLRAEAQAEGQVLRVQLQSVRKAVALLWPQGSLPTILLSLALWPLAQLAALVVPPLICRWVNRKQPALDVFTVPTPSFEFWGASVGLRVGGLALSAHAEQLAIRGDVSLV